MVSLDIICELSLGESEPWAIFAYFLVVVVVVSVRSRFQVARSHYFTFLNRKITTSMRLIFVFWVHFGEAFDNLEGATNSIRFFSIYTYGLMYDVGLIIEYWFWNVGGAYRLTPKAISGLFLMVERNLDSLYLPSKNLSINIFINP